MIEIITTMKDFKKMPKIEAKVIFVMPFLDQDQATAASKIFLSRANTDEGILVAIRDDERNGFVSIVNQVYKSTSSDLIGYVASDAFPSRRWLEYSLSAFSAHDIGLLSYNDGKWMGKLASFGLVQRSWVTQYYPDYLFFPEYNTHFADTELSVLAHASGKFGYNANIVIMEVDYNKDKKTTNPTDKLLFMQRMAGLEVSEKWKNPAAFQMFFNNVPQKPL